MSDNLQKLVGLVAMTVLVVLGVVLTNDDDTDYSRNRSFRETAGTFAGADRVEERDCCDQTLVALKQIQDQLVEHGSQLGDIEMLLGEHGSQLEALQEDFQWSTSPPSPEVQEIADQMAETCPHADPVTWGTSSAVNNAGECLREYLVGFPLELARQVVLTHGKFGFFHRYDWDLANENWTPNDYSKLHSVTTDEACGPIFYGYSPPLRVAIAVDTYQGVVLPLENQFLNNFTIRGYVQDLELAMSSLANPYLPLLENMHWPTYIEKRDLCQ